MQKQRKAVAAMLIQRVVLNHIPRTAARSTRRDGLDAIQAPLPLRFAGLAGVLDGFAHAHHGHFLERGGRDVLVKAGVFVMVESGPGPSAPPGQSHRY